MGSAGLSYRRAPAHDGPSPNRRGSPSRPQMKIFSAQLTHRQDRGYSRQSIAATMTDAGKQRDGAPKKRRTQRQQRFKKSFLLDTLLAWPVMVRSFQPGSCRKGSNPTTSCCTPNEHRDTERQACSF